MQILPVTTTEKHHLSGQLTLLHRIINRTNSFHSLNVGQL
jgi:hypothetical protein